MRKETEMKILLLDIETAPNLAYVWDKYEQDVISFKTERFLLSFAYKWLGEKKVHAFGLPNFRGYKKNLQDDGALVRKLWSLFDQADIIIGHNGDYFDIRMSNAFFARHGLNPPHPYRTIDTKKIAKSKFRFNSNKLDDLGSNLGLGRKIQTGGFQLWLGCLAGDVKAWAKMLKYNKQDVVLLEKVYLKLRPWMNNHPNLNVEHGEDKCPICQSVHINQRGWAYTNVTKRKKFVCLDCGKWSLGATVKTGVKIR